MNALFVVFLRPSYKHCLYCICTPPT